MMGIDLSGIVAILPDLNAAFIETIIMISISLLASIVLGLPLGVLLYLTENGMGFGNRIVNVVLGTVINIVRSIPFIILLVLLIPFTRLLVGSAIGPVAASVSLSVAAIPFFARLVETSIREIDKGVIEAAIATGATRWMLIKDVLLLEARSSIIAGITLTTISLLGFSAMAGFLGGGGIGDFAIRFGYYRYVTEIMVVTVVILIILVQCIQMLGDYVAKAVDKR